MTTAELRKAIKAVDPAARISSSGTGWTIRTRDEKDAVTKIVASLGLVHDAQLDDVEGARHDWIHVLHVGARTVAHASKNQKVTTVKLKDRDWNWVRAASEGDEYAQARLADLLGWDGDNDQLAIPREHGEDYSIVEIVIDGSVYARYKIK